MEFRSAREWREHNADRVNLCANNRNLANPTSNSIYQKIGYRPVCDVQDWIFE